ncbi:MAG: GGDEF domain-containing protein [Anaerolineales bacterium]|nr:GGDEF domain-containing protein [Anaerolineales bacterium]
MFNRLRTGVDFRQDPELRIYRSRLANRAIAAIYIVVTLWLLLDIFFFIQNSDARRYSIAFDAAAGILLLTLTFAAYRLNHWGDSLAAGYLLAGSLLLFAMCNLIIFPNSLVIMGGLLFIPILIAGSIVGGTASFIFSGLATLALCTGWLIGWRLGASPSLLYQPVYGPLYLSSQALIHQTVGLLLFSFSRNIERNLEYLRNQTDQMTELAHTDPLTGLANRRYMIEQLDREFLRARRYGRPLALLYLDLDGFKEINDHFGHLFGDDVLSSAAVSMRSVLRSTDLLARIGGDEFAVLLPETDLKGAVDVVNKLRRALLALSDQLGTAFPKLMFSAGVAQLIPEDESIDDLLARADDVQYQAKATGKGEIRTQLDIQQLPLFRKGINDPN